MGGTGLELSYNIPIWAVASWVICLGLICSIANKNLLLPRTWPLLCFFPASIIVTSLITGTELPVSWFFRELYILAGLAFIFSLFQLNLKEKDADKVLVIIGVATALHALLGCLQTFIPVKDLPIWTPPHNNWSPKSIFQQINVQTSFIATGSILIVYLISKPLFNKKSIIISGFWTLAFGLCMYVISASGSRVGLLSIVLGLPLLIFCRKHQLKNNKNLLLAFLIFGSFCFYQGADGLQRTLDKTSKLTTESYTNARTTIYTIGGEIITKKPWFGHGIGGFQKSWNEQSSNFYLRHPEATIPRNLAHPHNELLLWAIEGGIATLASLLITLGGIGLAIFKCGLQRGGAYAAMLIPITLHTQVELPFYISSFHWFLWLFLAYLPLRHHLKSYQVRLSTAATKLSYGVILSTGLSATLFMYHTSNANAHMVSVMLHEEPLEMLKPGLSNLYLKREAENILRITKLFLDIKSNNTAGIKRFEEWAEKYIQTRPEPRMYRLLIISSKALDPDKGGCDAAKLALLTYPYNQDFKSTNQHCNKPHGKNSTL